MVLICHNVVMNEYKLELSTRSIGFFLKLLWSFHGNSRQINGVNLKEMEDVKMPSRSVISVGSVGSAEPTYF